MAVYNAIKYNKFEGGAGALIPISTVTFSGEDTATFTGIDSTYDEYLFIINSIHPSDDFCSLFMKARDGGSDYDAPALGTLFIAHHNEADSAAGMQYQAGTDTDLDKEGVLIHEPTGNEKEQCSGGMVRLYHPSSTTYVKHFLSRCYDMYPGDDSAVDHWVGGYYNVTAAIDGIQFFASTGTWDTGTIQMFGVH